MYACPLLLDKSANVGRFVAGGREEGVGTYEIKSYIVYFSI